MIEKEEGAEIKRTNRYLRMKMRGERKTAWAVILIILGCVLLFNSLGIITWSIWILFDRFWAVWIILAGFYVIFSASRLAQIIIAVIAFVVFFAIIIFGAAFGSRIWSEGNCFHTQIPASCSYRQNL